MKKIVALLMAVILLMSSVAVIAMAADEYISPENEIYIDVDVDKDQGGHVEPDSGVHKKGDDVTYKFIPDPGYEIAGVWIDGVDYGRIDSYTFTNLQEDHDIFVQFRKIASPTTAPVTAKPDKKPTSPDTGSSDVIGLAVAGGVVVAAAIGVTVLAKKREDNE